jgi:hypothetical protein
LTEFESSNENTLERCLRRARFIGAMGEAEPSDWPSGLPCLHVNIPEAAPHEPHEDCWCSPVIEYRTEYVCVYRHRRVH